MQFGFMVIIFCCILIRSIYLRQQSLLTHPTEICGMLGGWFLLSAIAIYPFQQTLAYEAVNALSAQPQLIFLGLFKGVLFWLTYYAGQTLRKSTSSSVSFSGFISLGVVAVLNAFMGEELNNWQLLSVGLLFTTGLYFVLKGHISSQPKKLKMMFVLVVFYGCLFGSIDHNFLTHCNWYGSLVLSGMGVLFCSLVASRFNLLLLKRQVFGKKTFKVGVMMGMTEVIILSIFVVHVPVTLGWVAMTLAAPVVMVISARYWGEGHWQEQLVVGGLSYAAAIPLVIGT